MEFKDILGNIWGSEADMNISNTNIMKDYNDFNVGGKLPTLKQDGKNPWFGQGGYLQTGADVIGALSGLAGAYTGLQNYKLAKDKFGFEKGMALTNLANQGNLINEQRMNAANVGLGLAGSTLSDAQKEAVRNKVTAGNVKTTL